SIDTIIDKASVEQQYELSRGYSFLQAYLGLRVDFINLSAMLRLKMVGQDRDSFEESFLPHGTLKKDVFKTWWDASQESLSLDIPRTEPFGGLKEGLRRVSDDFVLLEREMQEVEIEFLLSTRRLTFGYEPLVGYSVLKRVERRNIGKVVTGLRYGLEPEITRRSIAWFD
ncbi:hypothetical protein GF338_12330, partial [candidate division WOR-3 bacterium]|nr:hypothetical protein [candidate division WOR-3 bacterium]